MAYAAIVLAAGLGTRFGGGKMEALLDGRPLLGHAIRIAEAAPVNCVVVVTRPGMVIERGGTVTQIELASNALSETLRAGLDAVKDADGAFIFLGDMPLVPIDVAGRLAGAIGSAMAALPVYQGRRGHPVLLSQAGFALAEGMTGDHGLGGLLRGRTDVVEVPLDDSGAVFDVDDRPALAALQRKAASPG